MKYLQYDDPNYLTFDFETTNIDHGSALNSDNKIILVSWAKGLGEVKYALATDAVKFSEFLQDVSSASFLIAHHAKFELQWLAVLGFNLHDLLVWDTMIAEYVYAGNRSFVLSLEASCARHGIRAKTGFVPKAIKAGVCPASLPSRWVADYCIEDVTATRDLFISQKSKYKSLIPVIYTRCLLTPVLADIEKSGMHVDKESVIKEYRKVVEEEAAVLGELDKLTGGINPASPKQVAAFLYDELKFKDPAIGRGGKVRYKMKARSASRPTIEKLVPVTDRQKKFIELKQKQAVIAAKLSKTIRPLYNCVTETTDHILYGTFNQCITVTQRLSSSGREYGVQFHNFPRKYKYLFTARDPENYVIVEADEAQLEFRGAVFLGQDRQGFADIKNKIDVHSFTASIMHDCSYEYVYEHKDTLPEVKEWRQSAKSDTFKPLYGGESGTDIQRKYYAAFRQKYKDITKTQESWKHTVLENKKLTTCTGLVFYWPDTTISPSGYITNSTSICNFPVQSLATADIVPVGLRLLWDAVAWEGLRVLFINTVHDSVIVEAHKDDVSRFKELAEYCLNEGIIKYLKQIYNIDFNVPLEAEISGGSYWGAKEIK